MENVMNYTNMVTSLPIYKTWQIKEEKSIWKNSIFEFFHKIPSPRSKGSQGEKLVEQFMTELGHSVSKPESSDHDRIISNYKTEIKVSTSWDNTENKFTWQQIRDQDYERIIFVGINPNNIEIFWATKSDLKKNIFGKDKYRQHGGKKGKQDLYWLQSVHKLAWFRDIGDF
jgi:hypothetical protein